MSPATIAWGWMKNQTATAFDRYVGRRANILVNVVVFAMFAVAAFFIDHGWARDIWWCAAGAQLGYIFMWVTYPRFTRARKAEMEAEISTILAGTMWRMTRECFGGMTRDEYEKEMKRTLQ